jgi:hypothetical protein
MGAMPMMYCPPVHYYQPVHYKWKRGTYHKDRVYLLKNGRRIGRWLESDRVYQKKTKRGKWGKERKQTPVRLPRQYRRQL